MPETGTLIVVPRDQRGPVQFRFRTEVARGAGWGDVEQINQWGGRPSLAGGSEVGSGWVA